jgi:hypothetical protein
MGLLFDRNQCLLAKVEAVRGTDAAPTNADDAVRCAVLNPTIDGQPLERFDVSTLSAQQEKLVNKKMSFSIQVYLKGSGAAGTAPDWGALMLGCGTKETVTPVTSVVYAPENHDTSMKSVTIWLYKDGLLFKAVGCMGNASLDLQAGQYPVLTFQMSGKFSSVADAALVTGTYDTTDPVQVASVGLSFGAWNDAVCRNFGMETGNQVADRLDVNSSDGFHSSFIGARNPRWSARIEAVLEATNDFFADWLANTTMALDLAIGAAAGNIASIAAPKAASAAPKLAADGSLNMYDLGGQLLESSAEDNWTITLT